MSYLFVKSEELKSNPREFFNTLKLFISSKTKDVKFIDPAKFRCYTLTKTSATETVCNKYFDNPSTLAIHAGTNDNEHSTLDYCFDNFQTLINQQVKMAITVSILNLTAEQGRLIPMPALIL